MDQLGPNALGEVLEPGRVTTATSACCCRQDPLANPRPGPSWSLPRPGCCILGFPQPDGSLVYGLLTGHPEREAGELVFVADLAVVGCWRDGEVTGLQVDDLGLEEARSLTRPAS